jgi:hypothetical protein
LSRESTEIRHEIAMKLLYPLHHTINPEESYCNPSLLNKKDGIQKASIPLQEATPGHEPQMMETCESKLI